MRSGIGMVSKLQCGRKIVSDPLIDVVGVARNDGMNNRCSSRGGGSIHGSCNNIIRYYSDVRKLTVVAVIAIRINNCSCMVGCLTSGWFTNISLIWKKW